MKIISLLYEKLSYLAHVILFYLFRIFPVKNNKVVFTNFLGKGYGCNPKYICEELLKSKKQYDIVWVVNDMNTPLPSGIRKVENGSLKWIYELCTAKVWVNNTRFLGFVRKRNNQYYIQTWHGDNGIKKVENDAGAALDPTYKRSAINDSKMADLFVSGTKWFGALVKESFWYDGEVDYSGYPRRDIFYKDPSELGNLKTDMGINEDSKILFYAPTFRKNQEELGLSIFMLDWENLLDAAQKRFGGIWVGAIRLHPNISHLANQLNLPENVYNLSDYPDIQEILAVSDICISDYSSTSIDFAVIKKPAFIYAPDFEDYKNDRDLYYSFEELPFKIAQNQKDLADNILNFNEEEYKVEHKKFFVDKIQLEEDGTASNCIANRIAEICGFDN